MNPAKESLRNLFTLLVALTIFTMYGYGSGNDKDSLQTESKTAYDYVNPFIGTKEMGHTYPGATVPFGMVQLSPDTDNAPACAPGCRGLHWFKRRKKILYKDAGQLFYHAYAGIRL